MQTAATVSALFQDHNIEHWIIIFSEEHRHYRIFETFITIYTNSKRVLVIFICMDNFLSSSLHNQDHNDQLLIKLHCVVTVCYDWLDSTSFRIRNCTTLNKLKKLGKF